MEKGQGLEHLRASTAALRQETTGVLLVGGRSTRMGSPKERLPVGDETFQSRILACFPPLRAMALSVAAGGRSGNGLLCWEDTIPDCGPMGAIYTALARAETDYVLLSPCDTPGVTEELFLTLLDAWRPGDDCVVPVTGEHVHPLTGLYRVALLPQAQALMEEKCYRPRRLLDGAKTRYVTLPPALAECMRNLNTPEEYRAWLNG